VPIVCREGALASGMFSLKGSITVKLGDLGLDSAEINSGGFLPAPHLPIEDLRASQNARDEYLELFTSKGVTLTALNCNGNPLHPDPEVREKHANDVRDAIALGALLGVDAAVQTVKGEKVDPFILIPYELVTTEKWTT
jgi:sugar phosphate isomerase/epimerase